MQDYFIHYVQVQVKRRLYELAMTNQRKVEEQNTAFRQNDYGTMELARSREHLKQWYTLDVESVDKQVNKEFLVAV